MREAYVDADHIRAFVEAGSAQILDSLVSAQAEHHLEQSFPLRLFSTIIDWDKVPSTTLNWTQVSDDNAVAWAMTTAAGRSQFGLLLYNPRQPCLIGPIEFMVRHLDELVWGAPGCRVLFGVTRIHSGEVVFGPGVIEFNGKGELFANTNR